MDNQEIDRVKEEIAKYQRGLHCKAKGWTVGDWDDLPAIILVKYYDEADQILSIKGILIEADDQTIQVSLPADGRDTGLKVPYHLSNLGENIKKVKKD